MKTQTKFKETEVGMIPEDWEVKELGGVVDKLGDGLHGTPKYDESGEYYFVNGNNLVEGKIEFNSITKRCSKEEFEKYKKELGSRTLLISINGTLGNMALYNNEKIILGKSACYLNVKENYNLQYIKYILKNNSFQDHIQFNATGTTIKNVSLKQMRDFKFAIPKSSNEQKAIAKILFDLDSKINSLQKQNEILEDIGTRIFNKSFLDKSNIGDKKNIQEIIEFEKGVEPGSRCYETEKTEANVRFIRVGDINSPDRSRTYIPLKLANNKFCKEEDILLSLDATIGIVRIGMTGVHSGGVRKVYAKDEEIISKGYIYFLLKSKNIQDTMRTYAQGTTILHAGNSLNHMEINVLSNKDFQEFNEIINPLFDKMILNLKTIKTLTQIRDSLLPKLMSGKIRVPVSG